MLKMGLIGLGKMGKYHLNLYDEIPSLKLAALCDASEEQLNKIPHDDDVKLFHNYKDMLPYVDIVTIAAPTKYHYDIAKECLHAGKHVLLEKPITTNYNEAVDLFNIAESKGLVLHVGHVERFNGAIHELRKIINNPKLIEARRVGPYFSNFKNDSIVLDLMIHDLDIAISLAGADVVGIQAAGSPVYSPIADFASVNLIFSNNVVAHLLVSRINQNKERILNITQEDALIVLDYGSQDINITRKGSSHHIFGDKELMYKNEYTQERLFVYKDNPLKLEILHFINCVKKNDKRMVTIEHELTMLKFALTIDELIKSNTHGVKSI